MTAGVMGMPAEDAARVGPANNEPKSEDLDAEHEVDDLADAKPAKKRRFVSRLDKKYGCPQPGCDKSYSRAEHLYRHQLNHTPKQIYRCDFPGCDRHFVRADLCARHKERHTAKGSHLQRKDAFLNSQRDAQDVTSGGASPPPVDGTNGSPVRPIHAFQHPSTSDSFVPYPASMTPMNTSRPHFASISGPQLTAIHPETGLTLDSHVPGSVTYAAYPGSILAHTAPGLLPSSTTSGSERSFSYDTMNSARSASHGSAFSQQPASSLGSMHPPPLISSPPSVGAVYAQQTYPSPSSTSQNYRSPTGYSSLPSFGFPHAYGSQSSGRAASITSPTMTLSEQHPAPCSRANSLMDFNAIDQMTAGYSMPVFGTESYNRSPPIALNEDLFAQLFNSSSNGLDGLDPSPPAVPESLCATPDLKTSLPRLEPDGTPTEQAHGPWPASYGNGLDISMRESTLSEKKRQRLLDLIITRFNDVEQLPDRKPKADIIAGNKDNAEHVLSLHMFKTFLTSFWVHIHQQMPILHRPTFNPETCPELLLLAMMCLGATCLERSHQYELTQNCAELAFFLAYHVRWEVFRDADFRPTAKLWTFQTMLLLELFEKMYSTRALHERAHIHHATTLTVMRRGSSLIGRSAWDSPQMDDDPTRTPPGPEGSINTSGQNTPDAFWNRWITAEATRRAAFAAFIIDSTHATLFGHAANLSPHDLKLPLPCDEALWSATSSAEVQRIEASLAANGFKPTSFIDGLKRTLNGQKVRTNTFGRVILMAGLLNVSWHMNQRDLQVSSLGASSTLGNQMKWRLALTRAFDFWRRDFDDSLSKNEHWLHVCDPRNRDRGSIDHRDNVFESRTCMHSLAHMAMHVDMIDCQVFAGCDRILGRVVTDADRTAINRRIREQWAPSARARDAVFYALRFLCEVLIPEEELTAKRPHPHNPPTFHYSARDDYLLNRPWVLYFAALIVWTYGYALDGPIRPSNYTLTSRELQIFDMQRYLIRMGGVASPDDLENLKDRNSCLGLLLLLRECFRQPRWELLQNASVQLQSCINMLLPGNSEVR